MALPALRRTLLTVSKRSLPALTPEATVAMLALLLGLQPLTTDLYLPAMPLLAKDLSASMPAVQATMSALLLAFGFGQLAVGALADRFGRRPVLLWGLTLHSLGGVGASLAPQIETLVVMRAIQGLGLAAAVVCARAMVRDLFEPHEGAPVMSRALTGLGVIAFVAPALGALATGVAGWRAAMLTMAAGGAATAWLVARRLPETAPQLNPQATAAGPLLSRLGEIARHPGFRAWALLVSGTYGGLYVLLAGTSFVYMGALGLSRWQYGLALAVGSLFYIAGTVHCRRVLPRRGLTGAVRIGAVFTLVGAIGLYALGLADVRNPAGVLLFHWLYGYGHGFHQPCGQVGAVAAFPHAAGTASALAGFALAVVAFGMGLWLGVSLDGSLRSLSQNVAAAGVFTALVAWTLVQRHGAVGEARA